MSANQAEINKPSGVLSPAGQSEKHDKVSPNSVTIKTTVPPGLEDFWLPGAENADTYTVYYKSSGGQMNYRTGTIEPFYDAMTWLPDSGEFQIKQVPLDKIDSNAAGCFWDGKQYVLASVYLADRQDNPQQPVDISILIDELTQQTAEPQTEIPDITIPSGGQHIIHNQGVQFAGTRARFTQQDANTLYGTPSRW